MKILLVIANYKDNRQKIFDEGISLINQEYCRVHGFNYIVSSGIETGRESPIWQKFFYVKKLLNENALKDGDKITVLDADMVFAKISYVSPDKNFSYETGKSFSYAIDNGNTHCMGNYTMTINEWSRRMVDLVIDEERFQKYKSTEIWQRWAEQASWYSLCGIKEHSWIPFLNLPNYGWHSNKTDDTLFSIEELEEHIEIRPPEWNTTLLEEEADDPVSQMLQKYNIIRTKKENTIIRHFGGGQPWREEYFNG
jgi:hypothetical protein